jgi:hypothetical protein
MGPGGVSTGSPGVWVPAGELIIKCQSNRETEACGTWSHNTDFLACLALRWEGLHPGQLRRFLNR